jgi:four helix bundle protein
MTNYKNLEVWKHSMEMVKEIYILTKSFPPEEKYGLISQTNRAAVSIPVNIAEGMGRKFVKEKIQFLHVSRGSVYELDTLLNIARMTGTIEEKFYKSMSTKIESSIRLINGFIKYLEQRN